MGYENVNHDSALGPTCLTVKARGCVERLILCVIKRTIIAAISLFIDSFKGCVWDSLDSSVTSCPPCLPFIPSYSSGAIGLGGKQLTQEHGLGQEPEMASCGLLVQLPFLLHLLSTGLKRLEAAVVHSPVGDLFWGCCQVRVCNPHECLEIHSLGRKGSGEHACYFPWWLLRESRAQTGQP